MKYALEKNKNKEKKYFFLWFLLFLVQIVPIILQNNVCDTRFLSLKPNF